MIIMRDDLTCVPSQILKDLYNTFSQDITSATYGSIEVDEKDYSLDGEVATIKLG